VVVDDVWHEGEKKIAESAAVPPPEIVASALA